MPLILIASLFLFACTVSKHRLPQNPVDDPVILPEKMNRHLLVYNRGIHNTDDYLPRVLVPIVLFAVPARGLTKNTEVPAVILPYYTYLFGKNDYYETGKITDQKPYHLMSFGGTNIFYSSIDGLGYGLGLGYQFIYKHDIIRSQFGSELNWDHASRSDEYKAKLKYSALLKTGEQTAVQLTSGVGLRNRFTELFFGEKIQYILVDEFFHLTWVYRLNPFIQFFSTVTGGINQQKNNPEFSESSDFKMTSFWDYSINMHLHW